jgi:hypothetical protein
MRLDLITPLIAGCVAQVAADVAAASVVDNAVASSPKTHDVVSAPTNEVGEKKQHRLLQKMKKRYNASNRQGGGNPDIGILARKSDTPRFLQDDDYDYYCPRETCPNELCECADKGGSLEDCTTELQNVCRAGRLGDCVFSDYVQVYEEVYCPFVACTVEGFREAQCDCAFYDLYCSRLGSDECNTVLDVSTDDPDKKPFFGCDETELQNVCAEAHTCRDRGDLQGLPDLGTWQGSVTTGIRSGAGESFGGSSVVAGVTLMSMLWLMVNV